MGYFKAYLSQIKDNRPPLPEGILLSAKACAARPMSPEDAEKLLSELEQYLAIYSISVPLFISSALVLEKTRRREGMLETWTELAVAFPEEVLPLRMSCRWFRRLGQFDEGLQRLHQMLPNRLADEKQAVNAILGYDELEAYADLNSFMENALEKFPKNKVIRIRFIKSLLKQNNLVKANEVAQTLQGKLGPEAKKLIANVSKKYANLQKHNEIDPCRTVGQLIEKHAPAFVPNREEQKKIGKIVFITGQLGAGGAERQMTRIAAALKNAFDDGSKCLGGYSLSHAPWVCVRHITAATGANFFLPVLQDAGVETHILAEQPELSEASLEMLTDETRPIFNMLSSDLKRYTLQLVDFFRREKVEIAYLWQDGGVLSSALAAVLAGVPRIVTSFRGLPPNLRTELLRCEMPDMYKALFKVPSVTFSANSQSTATAYEEWLELPSGSIKVLHNAVPMVTPEGSEEDEARWNDIQAYSPKCTQTVLGIFRFDQNKRPQYWVNLAIQHCRKDASTRFVIVGRGDEFTACQAAINQAGMQHRIFLTGPSQKVGFWLHKSDMLMHLARMEGLPNVVIEAHLAGVPVLATPAGGTAEVLQNGITGCLLSQAADPPEDEILSAIGEMLSKPEHLSQMGSAAKEYAESRFLLDQAMIRTLDLLSLS